MGGGLGRCAKDEKSKIMNQTFKQVTNLLEAVCTEIENSTVTNVGGGGGVWERTKNGG